MREVPKEQILSGVASQNPWWEGPFRVQPAFQKWSPRPYLQILYPLVKSRAVRRAVVLMGPRRVGKTVLIHHAIDRLLSEGIPPNRIAYLSVDHPLYNGQAVEQLIAYLSDASGTDFLREEVFVFLDEIQYLKSWEVHIKSIVDSYPRMKVIVSGSAAAALKLRSSESGAGRFTDFLLPPLTFYEYLSLLSSQGTEIPSMMETGDSGYSMFQASDLGALNDHFLNYLNFGGYPEVVLSLEIQSDPGRFIKSDIIDKVLLRDLPSLYGIQDIQELNYLFTTLAYNTANEVSLEELSKKSGVAKNTIKRYIDYLEAAFLIRIVHRIDRSGRRFQRANYFKVYLTNPSMRSALFSRVLADDPAIGNLVETAVYSQWFHSEKTDLHYARWKDGEVDMVNMSGTQKVVWVVEAKWSDHATSRISELQNAIRFCTENKVPSILMTTRTIRRGINISDVDFEFIPASEYCYTVGYNLIRGKETFMMRSRDTSPDS